MFEREAELHAAVIHRNVVSVFGSGVTAQGEPYLAMEYVDGCDAFRLLRRAGQEKKTLPVTLGLYVAREVLEGLAAVHSATDAAGNPLHIIHRDVTPSNLYLSRAGDVKLGDFGIARSASRAPMTPTTGEVATAESTLMGKFSYLSPEQVAGEPFDHRADLFSMATVLTEMVIGQRLFPGTGQLQILLAIRDCRLDPLEKARKELPPGLVPVLEKALSRDPDRRYPDARSFLAALLPFQADAATIRRELGARVTAVQAVSSESQLAAVRESARAMRAVRAIPEPPPPAPSEQALSLDLDDDSFDTGPRIPVDIVEDDDESEFHYQETGDYPQIPSFVHRADGTRFGPWTFAHLVEAIATGTVTRGDRVDYMGMGLRAIEEIPDLSRLLPKGSVSPSQSDGAALVPTFEANLAETTMLDVLAHVLTTRQSGQMVVRRPASPTVEAQQKDVFFLRGRLHHIASTNASELLGEFLVRHGKVTRPELDMALAMLPRYAGRMGDTLVGLGLIDGVEMFRAIREQGRERMTDLFDWREGLVAFYADAEIPAVDFPLDLDLPPLMVAGMETSHPGDLPMQFLEPRLDTVVVPNPRPNLVPVAWPPTVAAVLTAVQHAMTLREVLSRAVTPGVVSGADVARSLEVLLAMDLVRWG